MVEFVSLKHGQLSPEFVENKIIGFGSIVMVENEGVAEVNRIRSKIRHREHIFNSQFAMDINILAKHNRGFS